VLQSFVLNGTFYSKVFEKGSDNCFTDRTKLIVGKDLLTVSLKKHTNNLKNSSRLKYILFYF